MIRRIKHKGLKRLYQKGGLPGFAAHDARRLKLILQWLDAAERPEDMDLPGLSLHELKGDRKGTWSVTVRANYRVTWKQDEDGSFIEIDYEDYH